MLTSHNMHVFPHARLRKSPEPGPLPTQQCAYSRFQPLQPVKSRATTKLRCVDPRPRRRDTLRDRPSVKKSSRHAESNVVQQFPDPVSAHKDLAGHLYFFGGTAFQLVIQEPDLAIETGIMEKLLGKTGCKSRA